MIKGIDIDQNEEEREIVLKHNHYVNGLNKKNSVRSGSRCSTLPDSKPPLSSVKSKIESNIKLSMN